ncbi:MAG: PD-(D/E)XK nuclease family protein [Planctomycetota bacterium]
MEFLLPLPDARLPGLGRPGQARARERPRIERGFLTGAIDLVFRHEGRHYIADWKGDLLLDASPAAVAAHVEEHYLLQARLYSLVLARVLGISDAADHERRFGGVAYVFLRHREGDPADGIWFARPGFEDLGRYEHELDAEAPRREEERA